MPDPALTEAGHGPVPYLISFAVALATSVAGAVGAALRFSGRIAEAESEARTAAASAASAEEKTGKQADEIRATRSELASLAAQMEQVRRERPSQSISELDVRRQVQDAIRDALRIEGERHQADFDRIDEELARLRAAAEKGVLGHHQVELTLTRITTLLERDAGVRR